MSDYSAAGGVGSYEWNRSRPAPGYEAAVEVIDEAIACYTRLRNRAVTAGLTDEAERLRAEESACVADQRLLRPEDTPAVERILREYPPLIAWLRERIG
jgi:hypothetical protein